MGIQPWQTLSCPCPRELWQSVASGSCQTLLLQLLLCLPLLWEDRTWQENGDSAGLPLPVSMPWTPQALEGSIVTSGRWDRMAVTIAHLGSSSWELCPTAIPNKT